MRAVCQIHESCTCCRPILCLLCCLCLIFLQHQSRTIVLHGNKATLALQLLPGESKREVSLAATAGICLLCRQCWQSVGQISVSTWLCQAHAAALHGFLILSHALCQSFGSAISWCAGVSEVVAHAVYRSELAAINGLTFMRTPSQHLGLPGDADMAVEQSEGSQLRQSLGAVLSKSLRRSVSWPRLGPHQRACITKPFEPITSTAVCFTPIQEPELVR